VKQAYHLAMPGNLNWGCRNREACGTAGIREPVRDAYWRCDAI